MAQSYASLHQQDRHVCDWQWQLRGPWRWHQIKACACLRKEGPNKEVGEGRTEKGGGVGAWRGQGGSGSVLRRGQEA